MAENKSKSSRKRNLISLLIIIAIAVVFVLANWLLDVALTKQVKVSCHTPIAADTEYCVYHMTKSGLINDTHLLRIGTSPDRGLFYGVPYPAGKVAVSWSGDNVRVSMPGTTLTVESSEYIDRR